MLFFISWDLFRKSVHRLCIWVYQSVKCLICLPEIHRPTHKIAAEINRFGAVIPHKNTQSVHAITLYADVCGYRVSCSRVHARRKRVPSADLQSRCSASNVIFRGETHESNDILIWAKSITRRSPRVEMYCYVLFSSCFSREMLFM